MSIKMSIIGIVMRSLFTLYATSMSLCIKAAPRRLIKRGRWFWRGWRDCDGTGGGETVARVWSVVLQVVVVIVFALSKEPVWLFTC